MPITPTASSDQIMTGSLSPALHLPAGDILKQMADVISCHLRQFQYESKIRTEEKHMHRAPWPLLCKVSVTSLMRYAVRLHTSPLSSTRLKVTCLVGWGPEESGPRLRVGLTGGAGVGAGLRQAGTQPSAHGHCSSRSTCPGVLGRGTFPSLAQRFARPAFPPLPPTATQR